MKQDILNSVIAGKKNQSVIAHVAYCRYIGNIAQRGDDDIHLPHDSSPGVQLYD
jgi:hypothetical protein